MKKLLIILFLIPIVSYSQEYKYDYAIKEERTDSTYYIINTDEYGGSIIYKDSTLTMMSEFDLSKSVLKCIKVNDTTYTDNKVFKMVVNTEYIEFYYRKSLDIEGYNYRLIMYRQL